jgi:cytochrome c oxidase assembly protein subunit 15
VLGGLTVLKLLNPTIVSLHLINAVLFYSLLLWVAFRAQNLLSPNQEQPGVANGGPVKIFFSLFTVIVFLQLLLGGMVSSNHAGLVCNEFPKCTDEWFPAGSYLFTLQMTHRVAAFLILFMGLICNVFIRTVASTNRQLKFGTRLLVTLILLQGLLGMVNIFYGIPVWASVMHMANGLIIYTVVLLLTLNLMRISNKTPATVSDKNTRRELSGQLPREEMAT